MPTTTESRVVLQKGAGGRALSEPTTVEFVPKPYFFLERERFVRRGVGRGEQDQHIRRGERASENSRSIDSHVFRMALGAMGAALVGVCRPPG
jgi:hypothetical protein